MSLLKRKPKTLTVNTNVLRTSSSSSEEETNFNSEDTISLCSHDEDEDEDDENEDEESNPFIEGEKKLAILPKQLMTTFVCTTLIAIVWVVLSSISVLLHIEYRKKCNTSDAFGTFGICLLVFMTIRYTTSAILLGFATYRCSKINKRCGFEKLAEQYQSMLSRNGDSLIPLL